ncbi:hypothetical protein GCM10011504_50990 [Siccirubricoccus deserti]|nr:hypothetical protein GCM10011504_50990 [Siccirubricoccus deserti]
MTEVAISADALNRTLFGVAPLPAPDRGATDARAARHLQNRQPLRGQQDDVDPLHTPERTVPVTKDRSEAGAILRSNDDADGLGHAQITPPQRPAVNPPSGSVHSHVRRFKQQVQ